MSGFSADWLALREGADARARDVALARCLRRHRPRGEVLTMTDLAAGTGSNLRWLAPRLGGRQEWLLVDNDPRLLAALPDAMGKWARAAGHRITPGPHGLTIEGDGLAIQVRTRLLDLAADLDRLPLPPHGLVTASALLDLVSRDWIGRLAARCAAARADALFALTYDGRMHLDPPDPEDERIRTLINRHQQGDKGFGPALGPAATGAAADGLAAHGYRVWTRPSDWRLGAGDAALREALLAGWTEATCELAPKDAPHLRAWHRRRAHLANYSAVVGHHDLLALAPA